MSSENNPMNILLVDDKEDGLLALQATLEPLGQRLVCARSGKEALRLLLKESFALILLDVVMPEMDGFETAQFIRAREQTQQTPIIFLTGLRDGDVPKLRAYAVGAVDYVVKPYEPEILRSKVSVFVELARHAETVRRQGEVLRAAQEREHARELEAARRALEIERVRIRAEELQRALQLRDEFMSIASHELRTPLTSLKLNLHATRSRLAGTGMAGTGAGSVDERFSRLDKGVAQLTTLVEQLLDVSRLTNGRVDLDLAETNLARLTQEVLGRFEDEALRTGTELRCTLDESAVGQWCAFRLDQVVTNLIGNALKYAPGRPVDVIVERQGDEVSLRVRDHGLGIPPEDCDRIFDRFERGGGGIRRVAGLGIGLWIVRQVVQAMSGTVTVNSGLGDGAEFVVRLPVDPLRKVARETAFSEEPIPPAWQRQ
jgi:signal transduction histidine kinase